MVLAHRKRLKSLGFRWPSSLRLAALVPALLLLTFVTASAQDAKPNKWKRSRGPNISGTDERVAGKMFRLGTVRDEKLFDDLLKKKVAEFSWPENASKLPNLRGRIKTLLEYAGRAGPQDAHTRANNLLLNFLPRIVALNLDPPYHPGARYNWMMLLGQLDSKEPDFAGRGAQPLAAALPELLKAVEDDKQIDAVHVAAMLGVLRHAESGLAGPVRDTTAAAMTRFLAQLEADEQQNPGRRDAKGRAWMEMRAVNVLGALGVANADVIGALSTRLADTKGPLWLRCSAARALGKLDVSGIAQVDSEGLSNGFAELVTTLSQPQTNRRALLWSLECVKEGLGGGAVTKIEAPHLEIATNWKTGVDGLIALCEDKELRDDDTRFKQLIEDKIKEIRAGRAVADSSVSVETTEAPATATEPPTDEDPAEPDPFDDLFD